MKTAVVYYSLGGSTRSFARAEAEARGADLIEIHPVKAYNPFTAFVCGCPAAIRQKGVPLSAAPDLSGYERIILMAPVWAGHPAPPFNSMARLLPAGAEAEVLLVSSSGNSSKSRAKVRALIQNQGCTLTAQRDIRSHQ
ncbi:MAG TPA: hypothetical protein H9745_00220 [Candidatus Agathobaculum stercoravium]|nr:hypothetical protein [Candidatus Agathobaculum stercoravium]